MRQILLFMQVLVVFHLRISCVNKPFIPKIVFGWELANYSAALRRNDRLAINLTEQAFLL